jgi:D-alanine-D-alanine ligase
MSAEHEVSLASARNVIKALNKKKYQVVEIKISKNGRWNKSKLRNVDVVFPVLHGTYGEDGTIQGLLKLEGMPFVGAGVLGSSVGMDKDVMKRLLRDAGIPIGKFLVNEKDFGVVKKEFGLPVFVKPANLGSSVGVSKAFNKNQFEKAFKLAREYDSKVVIEEFIDGREIECSVLGGDNVKASVPGEVIPQHEFYSYEAKYIDEDGALLEIPAKLSKSLIKKVQDLAIKTFKVLECHGLARVDFFLKGQKVIVNEINTLPGFTNISMYPKLWEASGLSQTKLVDELIKLALKRGNVESKLKTFYESKN